MQAVAVYHKRDKYFLQARKNFIVGLTKKSSSLEKIASQASDVFVISLRGVAH